MGNSKKNISKIIKIVFLLFATLFTSYAVCVNVSFDSEKALGDLIGSEVNGVGLSGLLVFVAVAIFYYKQYSKFVSLQKTVTHALSAIFSIFMLIGQSYSKLGNWDFIFGNKKQFIVAGIVFVGYFILFDYCLALLYGLGDLKKITLPSINRENRLIKFINLHYQLFCFLVIFACWIPFIVLNLPGSVPYDGYRQLNMFFGIEQISNHHPWLLTEFYGFLMVIGRMIVSDNFGVFLIVTVSSLIEALCYSFVCKKIRLWGVPVLFNAVSVAFFAIVPIFGSYAQAVMKDGLFSAFFSLFFACYIDICVANFKGRELRGLGKSFSVLFIIELLVSLTRNNGSYMVIPADIFLLFFVVKNKEKIVVVALAICVTVSFSVIDKPIASAFGVKEGPVKEIFSIPFQQTARYIQEYPDEVASEEKEGINNLLSYDAISEKYIPERSDPVKDTYKSESTTEDLLEYFKIWWQMFKKHPGVYFEATFHNTFGYYYPFHQCKALSGYQFYINGAPLATGDFDIHYIIPDSLRNIISSYSELWRSIPGTAQIMNPGSYTWLVFIGIGYLLYKKRLRGSLALVAPFLNILVCIASPVNGYLRYAMPLMACAPVIVYWCMYYRNKKEVFLAER